MPGRNYGQLHIALPKQTNSIARLHAQQLIEQLISVLKTKPSIGLMMVDTMEEEWIWRRIAKFTLVHQEHR